MMMMIPSSGGDTNHIKSNENDTDTTSAAGGQKRKRWGVMPSSSEGGNTASSSSTDANAPTNTIRAKLASWLPNHTTTHSTTAASASASTPPEAVTRRVWVSGVTAEKPAAHFVAFCTERLAKLVANYNNNTNNNSTTATATATASSSTTGGPPPPTAPAAEHDSATREDTPNDDEDPLRLRIRFHGKGAVSDAPPLPGMPEEPLHVEIIVGRPDATVDAVVAAVDDLLSQAEQAETDHAAVQAAKDSRERALVLLTSSAAASLTTGGGGAYRPASVSAMIGTVAALTSNLPADRLAAALLHGTNMNATYSGMDGGGVVEDVRVPNSVVGCIIGRGGETIASLQATTGCKVQIQKEHDLQPGQTDRVITVSSTSAAAVAECRRLIEELVHERTRPQQQQPNAGGGSRQQQDAAAAVQSGHALVEMLVPDADVGLIIGKMGGKCVCACGCLLVAFCCLLDPDPMAIVYRSEPTCCCCCFFITNSCYILATIHQIQEQSGASIQVPRTGNVDDPTVRTLQITHPNVEGATLAKQLIENVLKSKPSFNQSHHHGPNGGNNNSASIQVSIPDKDVGLCIGRGGCVIKHMQQVTQSRIQIPPSAQVGESYRVATITGPAEGCQQAQQMISRIVAEQSSVSVMSGMPFTNDHHRGMHQQQQQQHGQSYAPQQQNQQGYSAEWAAYHAAQAAAAQQQQEAIAAVAPAPAAASDYQEHFFRYAYYYGEEAARQYYGAWAPAEGTPNPYGVNPAGISPAPVAEPAAAAPVSMQQSMILTPDAPVTTTDITQAEIPPTEHLADVRETSRRQVSNLPAWMTKKG